MNRLILSAIIPLLCHLMAGQGHSTAAAQGVTAVQELRTAAAQEFINIPPEEIRIDSVLPQYTCTFPLGDGYADSLYEVSIAYPEFADMDAAEVERFRSLHNRPLPELPQIQSWVGVERKRASLDVAFIPLVCRDGRYQKLISFKLRKTATARAAELHGDDSRHPLRDRRAAADRYADHSVLRSGRWVKLRISQTGVHQLTDELVRRAGFSDPSKVHVYGYGGAKQPEVLTATYLQQTDDLKEIATCTVGGRRLFWAQGPVSWDIRTSTGRNRNPYSSYGYYFITESDDEPLRADSAAFVGSFYPNNDDYHTLYEVDNYAWFTGGQNLYDSQLYTAGSSHSYSLQVPAGNSSGRLYITLTADAYTTATVSINDSVVGTMSISKPAEFNTASKSSSTYSVRLREQNTVTVRELSGGNMRLDYISLTFTTPRPAPDLLGATFAVPEIVGLLTNQDLHADQSLDMVIITPASGALNTQAQRLARHHQDKDSLRVKVIPADELFNEFSSGTPDANAYRRYLKMLYDRAEQETDMPRYLLLFGDCAWDNRMLSPAWANHNPDDYLLCYESDNSFSDTQCYVMEDYFALLDDGEGGRHTSADKPDVGVGRFPVRTAEQAQVMVDKTIGYANNDYAGDWQNTLCFMADDGNRNLHMEDSKAIWSLIERQHPGYNFNRIVWDAYNRTASSTGFSYPDVERLVKKQMKQGALMMNYTGHGSTYCLSHEQVVRLADFQEQTSLRLPLWITASCDIMPFDGQVANIGEEAVRNSKGGAIAFFGTTRTVYATYNKRINRFFTEHVLASTNGVPNTMGDAVRLAKNSLVDYVDPDAPTNSSKSASWRDLSTNKLHFALLGDPALRLACPTLTTVIDSIDGQAAGSADIQLSAGAEAVIKGHVERGGRRLDDFTGQVAVSVRDAEETIVCKVNNKGVDDKPDTAFTYVDRKTLFNGNDSVSAGTFTLRFIVPLDNRYSYDAGLLTTYAVNSEKTLTAHGSSTDFSIGGTADIDDTGVGPSIYCYLNTASFTNGGKVNQTPYFHAELADDDGLNISGSSIGHNLELIIDGDINKTYDLNNYFTFDFGTYKRGTLGYSIPQLSEGQHKLLFRAWDVLNNSSTAELAFEVEKGLTPHIYSLECLRNPASSSTTFAFTHDRTGSELSVTFEVFDMLGRLLWTQTEKSIPDTETFTIDYNLQAAGGQRLQTGVYLYRARVSNEGGEETLKAKKLIVVGQ